MTSRSSTAWSAGVIAQAQTAVEGYNFEIRKHLLEYDDVLNRQRQTIYDERLHILRSDDLQAETWRMLEKQVDEYLEKREPEPGRQASSKGDALIAGRMALSPGWQKGRFSSGWTICLPLTLPAPSAPFQGPLAFGGQNTAYPPFTISFLADQLAAKGQPVERGRAHHPRSGPPGCRRLGEQFRQSMSDMAQTTRDKYDESLARYQSLLDEKNRRL